MSVSTGDYEVFLKRFEELRYGKLTGMERKKESPTCFQMFAGSEVLVERLSRLPGTISMTVR